MKHSVKVLGLIALVAIGSVSCRDKDAEKRIAQLESRLAEMEGKPAAAQPSAATPTPEAKPEGPLGAMSFTSTNPNLSVMFN